MLSIVKRRESVMAIAILTSVILSHLVGLGKFFDGTEASLLIVPAFIGSILCGWKFGLLLAFVITGINQGIPIHILEVFNFILTVISLGVIPYASFTFFKKGGWNGHSLLGATFTFTIVRIILDYVMNGGSSLPYLLFEGIMIIVVLWIIIIQLQRWYASYEEWIEKANKELGGDLL